VLIFIRAESRKDVGLPPSLGFLGAHKVHKMVKLCVRSVARASRVSGVYKIGHGRDGHATSDL